MHFNYKLGKLNDALRSVAVLQKRFDSAKDTHISFQVEDLILLYLSYLFVLHHAYLKVSLRIFHLNDLLIQLLFFEFILFFLLLQLLVNFVLDLNFEQLLHFLDFAICFLLQEFLLLLLKFNLLFELFLGFHLHLQLSLMLLVYDR
jgi:hypothetical protein